MFVVVLFSLNVEIQTDNNRANSLYLCGVCLSATGVRPTNKGKYKIKKKKKIRYEMEILQISLLKGNTIQKT